MTNKQKQQRIDKIDGILMEVLSPKYYELVCELVELEIDLETDSNK